MTDQLPPVAVADPTCVAPSNSFTVEPASAVPVNVGVVTLVRLSPATPESLAEASTGVEGAAGAVRSTVTVTVAEVNVLEALSVVMARRS